MGEPDAPQAPAEPRFERFTARYPSGVVLPCHYPGGGATLWAARVDHLYAQVEPVLDSRVPEATL